MPTITTDTNDHTSLLKLQQGNRHADLESFRIHLGGFSGVTRFYSRYSRFANIEWVLQRIRRLSLPISIQEPIKPIQLPIQTLHQMLRLPRPRQIMILTRKDHEFRRHSVMLQRPK